VTAQAEASWDALKTAYDSYNATAAAASLNTVNKAATGLTGVTFSTAADAVTKTGDNVVVKLSFGTPKEFNDAKTAFNSDKVKQCNMATPINLCPGLNCDKTSAKFCMNFLTGELASGRRLLDSEQAEVRRLQTAAKISFTRLTKAAAVANAKQSTGTTQSSGNVNTGNDNKIGSNAVGLGVVTALALAVFQ
jgi:hypothetical protein